MWCVSPDGIKINWLIDNQCAIGNLKKVASLAAFWSDSAKYPNTELVPRLEPGNEILEALPQICHQRKQ
jgi:hypothetical protein